MITAEGVGVALVRKFANATDLELADSQQRLNAIKAVYQVHANSTSNPAIALPLQMLPNSDSGLKLTTKANFRSTSTLPILNTLKARGVLVRTTGGVVHECQVDEYWMTPAAVARAGLLLS